MSRHLYAACATLAAAMTFSLLSMAPAQADTRNINGWRSAEPCTVNTVCIHYRTWAEGARHVSYTTISEFTNHLYAAHSGTRGSEGDRELVRNNAASMNNHIGRPVYMHYSPNYQGNSDLLDWGWAGNLYYTANDNASMLVPGLHE